MIKKKIVILTGGGSRLPSLFQALGSEKTVEVVLVASHKQDSPGLELAKEWGIETARFLIRSDYEAAGKTRADLEADLLALIKSKNPDLIVMTGWMLILPNRLLRSLSRPVINVHPALNPAFPGPGNRAIEAMLEYGVKVAGATVHFVPDSGVDDGPVILQKAVKVDDDETFESLRQKLNLLEDELLPKAIRLFSADRLKIEGRRVKIKSSESRLVSSGENPAP